MKKNLLHDSSDAIIKLKKIKTFISNCRGLSKENINLSLQSIDDSISFLNRGRNETNKKDIL